MAKQAQARVDGFVKKAKEAVARKNYDLAIFSFMQAVTIQPNNVEIRLSLRAVQSKYAKQRGVAKFGAFKALMMAKLHKMLKKIDVAILDVENGLTANPFDVKLLLLLAELCLAAGHTEVAIWQRQSIADNVDQENIANLLILSDLYNDAGRGQEAIACLERIKEIDPKVDVDAKLREASAKSSSVAFERAAKEGSRAIIANAEESEKLELDAGRLRTDDQRRKAIDYRLAHDLKDRPKDHAIWLSIGDIAAGMDDFAAGYKEAIEYFKKAQEITPANSAPRDRIGDLEMKNLKLQIEAADNAVKGGDESAKKKLAELRKQDNDLQIKEFERRAKEQPLKADFHNKLGGLYMKGKRYDDAIGELQAAAKDPRFKISALTNLGRCLLATNNIDMAISQFERARENVELFDKYKDPMYYEAVARLEKGDKESAKKAAELFTHLYETDIKFRDVKDKLSAAQKILNG